LSKLASLCAQVESENGRKRKAELLGAFLGTLELEEVGPAVLILLAQVLPESERRSLDVGYRTVKRAIQRGQSTLFGEEGVSILEAYEILQRIARAEGAGSRRTKESLLGGLLARLSDQEREYLLRSLFGEMRIGVNEGVMLEAIARATGTELDIVRGANMLSGDIGGVAMMAMSQGGEALARVGVRLFTPIRPMLAEMSEGVEDALATLGRAAFEFKLDGARIQIHRDGDRVKVFTRRLTEVTESLPELVDIALHRMDARQYIVEGEAVAFKGRPLPFQDVMRRFTRVHDIADSSELVPIRLYLFDLLDLEGRSLIDSPYEERWRTLSQVAPPDLMVPRLVSADRAEVEEFYQRSLSEGHEGLVAKGLDSPYAVGKRGRRWLKIKKSTSLDLVMVAADWGYGRRTGWLSDYYLAAGAGEGFEIIGKTYKGFTDQEFEDVTRRLLDLRTSETKHTVQVKPEIVVEVVFDEIQKSQKYPSGLALRLARIKSIREDKGGKDADTIGTVREMFEEQFETKARLHDDEVREGSKNNYIARRG
jgi:DNA ligase-1